LQPTYEQYDILTRLTLISYPDGGSTSYCYTDMGGSTCSKSGTPYKVVTTKAITSSPVLNETSTVVFDGLGRTSQMQLNSDADTGGADYVDTTYDAMGRKSTVSNPHRSSSSSTDGTTTYVYDALSRVCVVGQPDGATVSQSSGCPTTAPTGDVFSQYVGNCTTLTDEAGKARKSCMDGLGRMTGVWEDPAGLNYETDYLYDALSDLTSVTQKGSNSSNSRNRTFQYDSLSRLTSAVNPESGTLTYTYDADGNVITKKAPMPNQTGTATVTTTNTYDKLNRLTNRNYSDGVTPWNAYAYDVAPAWAPYLENVVGRVANSTNEYGGSVSSQATATAYSYDSMGRVVFEWEQVPSLSPNGQVEYSTFDLAGNLASTENSAYNSFYYGHDGANRLTTVTASLSDSQHPATLYSVSSSVGFYPPGEVRDATLGNGLTETLAFNSRLQPCRVNVNSASAYYSTCTDSTLSGNVMDFTVGYNAGSNNGNIATWSATGNQTFSRSYTYDSLNRISTMTDSASSQACKGLSWTIDAWGNMTAQTPTGTCFPFSSSALPNNQLTGYTYDAAGNVTYDGNHHYTYDAAGNVTYDGNHHYTYDAENRIVQIDSGSTASYVYNENGKRVRKNTSSGCLEYFYGPNGLAESDFNGSWPAQYIYAGSQLIAEYTSSTTEFIHGDHLGSSRLVTAVNQSVLDNMDYEPFGQQNAGGSATTHKFTAKEWDAESGLHYFGARYNASAMGRFMSPDWAAAPTAVPYAHYGNPQSLNLYAYVENNPTTTGDPDGHGDAGTFCSAECRARYAQYAAEHPVAATLEPIAEFGTIPTAMVGGAAAWGSALFRNLLGLGLATAPTTVPLINEAIEGLTPGQNATLGRAGALGVSSIEKLGESGFVGSLENGARISAGFEKVGDALGVNISNIQSAARGSVNFNALESGAVNLAKSEGASSLTITATNVTNSKLAQTLEKAGYAAQQVSDNFGRTTVNYVKKICTASGGCQ
jgi:RHS repeat-associated protein